MLILTTNDIIITIVITFVISVINNCKIAKFRQYALYMPEISLCQLWNR